MMELECKRQEEDQQKGEEASTGNHNHSPYPIENTEKEGLNLYSQTVFRTELTL